MPQKSKTKKALNSKRKAEPLKSGFKQKKSHQKDSAYLKKLLKIFLVFTVFVILLLISQKYKHSHNKIVNETKTVETEVKEALPTDDIFEEAAKAAEDGSIFKLYSLSQILVRMENNSTRSLMTRLQSAMSLNDFETAYEIALQVFF